MSLVKQLNEKEGISKTLKETRNGDVASTNELEESQKDIASVLHMQIDVDTYKALMRLAQSQGMKVEALVARAIAALADGSMRER